MKKLIIFITVYLFFPLALQSHEIQNQISGFGSSDFQTKIKNAKNKVFPSVVFIKAIVKTYQTGKKSANNTSGSGVIISEKGEVLTNWHVINNAVELRCMLMDGRAYEATIIGSDKDVDIALLQLNYENDNKPFPVANLGDSSKLSEGDFIMAMGAPWGLSRSISLGIISCTNRYLEENSEYSLWIQTDASISPGNSGGPLVNTFGDVIGINTRGMLQGGDLGFAVPSNIIKKILPRIRKFGKVNWSWTGLSLQPLNDFYHNMYFDNKSGGVIISGTESESPGKISGLKIKDRILKINDKPVTALTAEALPPLREFLGLLPKGKSVRLEILREDKLLDFSITPREKGNVEGKEYVCPKWTFSVKTINRFDNPNLYFYKNNGVFVYGVKDFGCAFRSGLRINDIITSINGIEVKNLEDIKIINNKSLENIKNSSRVSISVLRNGLMRQIILNISENNEDN